VIRGLTVVAVDDDRDCREALALLLEDLGAVVRIAPGGTDALQEIGQACPDLVLTDLAMPGMSGADLLARLRRDYPTLPVVAVSAAAPASQGVLFDGLLAKPFDYATLLEMLEAVLRRRPALVRRQCRWLREEAGRRRAAARQARVQSAAIVRRATRRRASLAAA